MFVVSNVKMGFAPLEVTPDKPLPRERSAFGRSVLQTPYRSEGGSRVPKSAVELFRAK